MTSLPARRKKSAAERRAQRLRAEGRVMQRMLKCLGEVSSHRGCKLSRLGEVLASTLQTDLDTMQPSTEAQHTPEPHQQHETDINPASVMVTEREERQAGSAFPLGARTAARRLLRNHHVAEMLTTPMSPAAKDCQVCSDSVSDRAACSAVAPTESSATTHLQASEHRWESGIALPYSTLTELERHWLRNARRAVCNIGNVCSR